MLNSNCWVPLLCLLHRKFLIVSYTRNVCNIYCGLIFFYRKYEEIYPPDVSEFVYITDDTYTKKQVLKMEQLILKVLGFDVSNPTTVIFLTHICVHCNVPLKVMYLAMVCFIYIALFVNNFNNN